MSAKASTQRRAMRCMHNYARVESGRRRLSLNADLASAATSKAKDILRCDQPSHTACGRRMTYWLDRVGYPGDCGGAWENYVWGTRAGSKASVRSLMSRWLHSKDHRPNILRSRAREYGLAFVKGTFQGYPNVHVWVGYMGYRC
jgi:uncharacterized protein YkwD